MQGLDVSYRAFFDSFASMMSVRHTFSELKTQAFYLLQTITMARFLAGFVGRVRKRFRAEGDRGQAAGSDPVGECVNSYYWFFLPSL